MSTNEKNWIWIDLEMTGLSPEQDRILEIATIVTNDHLEILAEGPVFAIHQEEERLEKMDDWNQSQHKGSGLLTRVRSSTTTESIAEDETLAFLQQWVPAGMSPMCGNSICQDRRFLSLYMPRLANYFHYRNLDVSTIKILAQRWAPHVANQFRKKSPHLALEDIRESIEELRFYQRYLFSES